MDAMGGAVRVVISSSIHRAGGRLRLGPRLAQAAVVDASTPTHRPHDPARPSRRRSTTGMAAQFDIKRHHGEFAFEVVAIRRSPNHGSLYRCIHADSLDSGWIHAPRHAG